jgi:polyphenol oxidase
MIEKEIARIKMYKFEILAGIPEIKHFVTGREGGKSSGELGGLNLSFKVEDDPENVKHNRWLLASALDIMEGRLIFPQQTHSTNVKAINHINYTDNHPDTDALITNVKGLCIAVMSADCVPILLFDPKNKAVGAIHAGWKGTVGKIVEKTLKAMVDHYGTTMSDLVACIGPSICKEVYEVGPEVIEQVEIAFGTKEGIVYNENDEGKGYLDLWQANVLQLKEMGLKQANIEISGFCTFQNHEKFFSARKSGNKGGRFAAGIMLK